MEAHSWQASNLQLCGSLSSYAKSRTGQALGTAWMQTCGIPEVQALSLARHCIKTCFKPAILCRLSLLEALIPVFGVGKGDGFGLEQLMQFVGKAFSNSNADVRAAATRVTTLVGPFRI